jgi:hypothetical protein
MTSQARGAELLLGRPECNLGKLLLYSARVSIFCLDRNGVADKSQFGSSSLQRWINVSCLALVLVFTAVEAVHAHPSRDISRHSGNSCLICISAHSNAPALAALPFRSWLRWLP